MLKNSRGLSLVELMIATVILSVAALAGVQSFRLITQGIRATRAKTIAANLVQERMEVLKNLSYYQLMVTTVTETNGDYTPNLVYDTISYPKETITLWGLPPFGRAVRVAYAVVSSHTVSATTSNSYDTGMKLVTVYLWWKDDDKNKLIEIKSLYANPDASNLDSGFTGLVKGAGGVPLANARISVVGNPEWSTTSGSDATSNFTLPVTGGTYSILYSANGYYDAILDARTCVRGAYAALPDVTLTQVQTGTVMGTVWISSYVLISQVVASTPTTTGDEVEYVELYNPTTFTWLADDTNLQLWWDWREGGAAAAQIPLTYVTASIAPKTFYMIANRASVTINGVTRTADARYTSIGDDKLLANDDGGICIKRDGASTCYDAMAWSNGVPPDTPPVAYTYGSYYPDPLQVGEQYVRYSTTNTVDATRGPAYHTYNNAANFRRFSPASYSPRNSSVTLAPVTGTPAHAAVISASDGYSAGTVAGASGMGTAAEFAVFQLLGVATGTWSVTVNKGGLFSIVSGVAVTNGGTTWIPNGATAPTWPSAGDYNDVLISTTIGGFVEGYVYGDGAAYSTPLPGILVGAANNSRRSVSPSGYFMIPVTTGTITVYANYNSDSPDYVTATYDATLTEGQIVKAPPSPYFHLGFSGRIYGYVTTGTAALPNIVVKATRGASTYEGVSDKTGYFYIRVPTNASAYTVTAVVDPIQTASYSPDPLSVTVASSAELIHVGTITVTGGAGTLTGMVREGASVITTGVLIVASEAPLATIGNPPPLIYGSSATGAAFIYYAASSAADGSYSLSARASTALNMRAFYSTVDARTGVVTQKTPKDLAAVTVTAGAVETGKDFTW